MHAEKKCNCGCYMYFPQVMDYTQHYMRDFLITIALILLPIVMLPAEGPRLTRDGTLALQNGVLDYTLEMDPGNDEWAEYVMRITERFLPAAEEYLGAPLPRTEPFIIHGRDVVLYDRPDPGKYGTRVGGVNFWDYIGIEYELTYIGEPALLFHELGHFWYGSLYRSAGEETNWLIE